MILLIVIIAITQTSQNAVSTNDFGVAEMQNDSLDTDRSDKMSPDSIAQDEKNDGEIEFLEDFIKFKTHEEIEAYFGSENVVFCKEEFGAGWRTNATYVYDDYESMVLIVWSSNPERNGEIDFITGNYKKHDYNKILKPGGSEYGYKSGLYVGMSLEELVRLNGGVIKFEDFAFSLGRQFIVGMVVHNSLNEMLKDYIIHLKYTPKITDYDNLPADYQYLQNERTVFSDDKNIIPANISVESILYSPCRCTIYNWEN